MCTNGILIHGNPPFDLLAQHSRPNVVLFGETSKKEPHMVHLLQALTQAGI